MLPPSQTPAVSDSNVLISRAVAADTKKQYATALVLYRSAIETLLEELASERKTQNDANKCKNNVRRQQLKATVKELLRRAEQLQSYLASSSSLNASSPSSSSSSLPLVKANQQQSWERSGSEKKNSRVNSIGPSAQVKITPRQHDYPMTDTPTNTNPDSTCNEKEWSFKFDLRFDVKSRIKTAGTSESSPGEEGGNLVSNIATTLMRWLPMRA